MKRMKLALHIWIAVTSVLSFVGGWVVFSHSTRPAVLIPSLATTSAQTASALAPIPSLDSLVTSSSRTSLQPLPSLQLSSSNNPTLVTRGS